MSFDSWMRERNPKHHPEDDGELSRELRAAYEAGARDARDADVLCDVLEGAG